MCFYIFFFFFQAEDGIRDKLETGVQTCALPIFGPESANNSVEAGDLIPTLLFGIPGGVPSAMLLGMLLTYGIQPGPSIVTEHLDLMYLIVWSFAIASVLGAILCFGATPMLAKLTKVPFSVLGAGL